MPGVPPLGLNIDRCITSAGPKNVEESMKFNIGISTGIGGPLKFPSVGKGVWNKDIF